MHLRQRSRNLLGWYVDTMCCMSFFSNDIVYRRVLSLMCIMLLLGACPGLDLCAEQKRRAGGGTRPQEGLGT